jgi:acetyl-CoA synthetase
MAEKPTLEKVYTPHEVAMALKIKVRTVMELLRTGRLRGGKVGRLWRVRESDLQAFIEKIGKED